MPSGSEEASHDRSWLKARALTACFCLTEKMVWSLRRLRKEIVPFWKPRAMISTSGEASTTLIFRSFWEILLLRRGNE